MSICRRSCSRYLSCVQFSCIFFSVLRLPNNTFRVAGIGLDSHVGTINCFFFCLSSCLAAQSLLVHDMSCCCVEYSPGRITTNRKSTLNISTRTIRIHRKKNKEIRFFLFRSMISFLVIHKLSAKCRFSEYQSRFIDKIHLTSN